MSEIQRLQRRFKRGKVTNFHISWGPDAHLLTPNERAREIDQVMDQIDAGNYTELDVAAFDARMPHTHIDDLLRERIDPAVLEAISE